MVCCWMALGLSVKMSREFMLSNCEQKLQCVSLFFLCFYLIFGLSELALSTSLLSVFSAATSKKHFPTSICWNHRNNCLFELFAVYWFYNSGLRFSTGDDLQVALCRNGFRVSEYSFYCGQNTVGIFLIDFIYLEKVAIFFCIVEKVTLNVLLCVLCESLKLLCAWV